MQNKIKIILWPVWNLVTWWRLPVTLIFCWLTVVPGRYRQVASCFLFHLGSGAVMFGLPGWERLKPLPTLAQGCHCFKRQAVPCAHRGFFSMASSAFRLVCCNLILALGHVAIWVVGGVRSWFVLIIVGVLNLQNLIGSMEAVPLEGTSQLPNWSLNW